tara:strand:+ start:51 stop:686 length:636 start_codon:yes stop_codon:yes gene_type:complete
MKIPQGLKSINVNYQCSHTTGEITTALSNAQALFTPVPRDTKGVDEAGQEFEFASLEAMQEVYRKPLADNNIGLTTTMCDNNGQPGICVTITHVTNEWIASKSFAPATVETLDDYTIWSARMRKQLIMFLLDLCTKGDTTERQEDDKVNTQQTTFDVAMAAISDTKELPRLRKLRTVIADRLDEKLLTPSMGKQLQDALIVKESELEGASK